MIARDLFSKLAAAGLSAGVFLLWWPEHHASASLGSLVARGALWTLVFEVLLVAFAPLERAVRNALRSRVPAPALTERLPGMPAPARVGGACVLACAGAAVPLLLLAGVHAPARPARAAAARPIVIVKRSIVRQRVVVREVVAAAPVVAHPPTVSLQPARRSPAPRPSAPRRAVARKRTATRRPAAPRPATTVAPVAPAAAPAPAATPAPDPAATGTSTPPAQ